ncbi:hypothetical protein XI06_22940 [Bradyrhizobium sp. CCBAU 11434]|uniref:hypothetical protein n=1 Tax=Bradyrhizobium sp. CCBAU 11434 TaxID=1630885 RepID=UPI0023060674|nr:hypothetical protein [Bradyrhizobium sp. CCBAU 11434]MDA9523056.1 hypothetical protein [Bradyrhizobium sp. CCBAU 11434]
MMGVVKLQFSPRTAPSEADVPDVLVPALAALRDCSTSLDILQLIDMLPDRLLPYLAWAASRRRYIPHRNIQVLIKCCGDVMLERALGRHRLRQLKTRYPVSEPFKAL